MKSILPLFGEHIKGESLPIALLYKIRRNFIPLFVFALIIYIIALYQMNPAKFSLRKPNIIPIATAPKELPFTTNQARLTPEGVPKYIHQSWKNNDVPNRFQRWQKKWLSLHPEWDYHLWTDEDNRELVKQYYPWFLGTYDALPMGIMRADAVRYMYMHHYGGVYADLDMEPLKATDLLLQSLNATSDKNIALLAYMGTNFKFEHNVPNAWMLSKPNHPFWLFCLTKIIELHSMGIDAAEYVTGPVMLYKAVSAYNEANRRIHGAVIPGVAQGSNQIGELTILKPGLIYPYDWGSADKNVHTLCWAKEGVILSSTLDEDKCKALFPEAYTITYWTHSWGI